MSMISAASGQMGASQMMQQAVAAMKIAVESQQAAVGLLTQAAENGQQLAASGRGSNVNMLV